MSLSPASRIQVLLVDDHAVVRMGFRLLLQTTPDIQVIGEADSGEHAIELYPALRPDVVVMDLTMPGMGGIEAVKRILAFDREALILALSAHEDVSHPRRILKAGAAGYLSKRGAAEALTQAIRDVMAGRIVIDPLIAQRLQADDADAGGPLVERLSEREFEAFLGLAKGQTVAQLAEAMQLSSSTVGTYLYNIKQKLGLQNQAEITLLAVREGLIEP
jgi:two-component system invasion response regulator UvrY